MSQGEVNHSLINFAVQKKTTPSAENACTNTKLRLRHLNFPWTPQKDNGYCIIYSKGEFIFGKKNSV